MELNERIAALEAKDEIRELTARYCHCIVDGDAAALAELFCSDGCFRMGETNVSGRDALLRFYTAGVVQKTHKPFVHNHVIELQGPEHATGRCSVEIRIFQNGEAITGAGHYLDSYRVEDGRWRIANREFHVYHFAPWKEGWTS